MSQFFSGGKAAQKQHVLAFGQSEAHQFPSV
jgi:hypothetical protein